MCVYVRACDGLRLMSETFLSHSPFFSFATESLFECEVHRFE